MYEVVITGISLIGWLAGQAIAISGHFTAGAAVMFLSLFFGYVFLFKIWEPLASKAGAEAAGKIAPFSLATLAMVTACFAFMIVKNTPHTALFLFALSGGMLFLAKPAGGKFFDFFEFPEKPAPVMKWEPWVIGALILVSAGIRFYDLWNLPPVGHGGEGLVYGNSLNLADKNSAYAPHVGGGTDWPTLTYYMGIFFAKVLGWTIPNFRISSALLGLISVAAFYFLTRRLTSPVSALAATLMYTVFMPHVATSRYFMPTLTLLFIPHMLCLALLLAARDKPHWLLYLAAGLACGFSLQGYVPGRGVLLLFLGWFLLLFITRKKLFFRQSYFWIFWLGFLIVSGNVVYYALRYPDLYWGYVRSVDPSRTSGVQGYLNLLISSIPSYAGMYYTKSAWDVMYHFPYKPLLDPVAGVLFASGLFLCAFAFWKPIPAVLLILFFGGMIPALLGRGSSLQPNAQRTLMTYPVIFLICAYAFERVKRAYYSLGIRPVYGLLITAGLAAALWSFQDGFRTYFFNFAKSPVVKVNVGNILHEFRNELDRHPDAELFIAPFLTSSDSFGFFIPPGKANTVPPYIDNMLVLKPDRDSLLFPGPFYANMNDVFRKCFPNADIKVVREEKALMNNELYTTMEIHQGGHKHTDQFAPFIYSTSVFIPKQDVNDFQTMLVMNPGGRVKVFRGSDFAEKYAGRTVSLKGALIMPEADTRTNTNTPVIFTCAWNGWKLVFDNKPKEMGRPVQADGGIHFFELTGKVPAGAKGDLPLNVMRAGKDLSAEGRVVAIGEEFGVRMFCVDGVKNWDKPYTYSHRMIAPNLRLYDGWFLTLPYSLTIKAMLKAPKSGEYEIIANDKNRFRVTVNGTVTYDNLAEPSRLISSQKIWLEKDKPVKFELIMAVENAPIYDRAVTLYVRGPGMDDFEMVPPYWLYPAD